MTSEADYRELISMLVLGQAGMLNDQDYDHDFQWGTDGDGWNEPESDWANCFCGQWEHEGWVQIDPARTGRPDLVDMALAWREHILRDVWKTDEEDD